MFSVHKRVVCEIEKVSRRGGSTTHTFAFTFPIYLQHYVKKHKLDYKSPKARNKFVHENLLTHLFCSFGK